MALEHWMPGERIQLGNKIFVIETVDLSPGGLTQVRPRTWKEWLNDLWFGYNIKVWISKDQFLWL